MSLQYSAHDVVGAVRKVTPTLRTSPRTIASDQLVLLDDHVVEVTCGSVRWASVSVGPRVGSWLRKHQINVLALPCPSVVRGSAGLRDCLSRDDLPEFLDTASQAMSDMAMLPHPLDAGDRDAIVFSGHQPGYFRTLSFYAKLATSEVFCVADDMQFVRCEWQNRQRFPRPGGCGTLWLTVPLRSGKNFESLQCKRVAVHDSGRDWRLKHWHTIESLYSAAPHFDRYAPFLHRIFQRRWHTLAALCEAVFRFVALELAITRPLVVMSSQVGLPPGLRKGERIAKEIRVIQAQLPHRNAIYLSGADAAYLDAIRPSGVRERDFLEHQRIVVKRCTIDGEYVERQAGLSAQSPAIVFLFYLGPDAGRLLAAATRCQ